MKKVALIVGHSNYAPGAVNLKTGLTEWAFNSTLASLIHFLSDTTDVCLKIFYRTRRGLPELVHRVNEWNPDFAISMHLNSANVVGRGSEVLYWHSSKVGKRVAEFAAKLFGLRFGRVRGAKPRVKGSRGWYVLAKVRAPIILCEPFFINNDVEVFEALKDMTGLALDYLDIIRFAVKGDLR